MRISPSTLIATWLACAAMASPTLSMAADWFPSAYGEGDELGAANLLSDTLALNAAKLVTSGKVYSLGIETNSQTPAFAPRGFKIYIVQPDQQAGQTLGPNKMTYNDDVVEGWFGVGTQIDGLGHLGIDNVYYNGNKAADFATPNGLTKLGIEKVPPIVTNGVLLDMAAHFGVARLEKGHAINSADLKTAAKAQKITITKGSVVLLHTGWMNVLDEDPAEFASGAPGLGRDGATYLASLGVIAIGGDSTALEAVPHEEGSGNYEVHQILLAKEGVYILENIDSRELAADKVYEFMFVLSPAKVTGAVQMIVNPIAIR
jgi:kynurenine formamidase